MSRHPNARLTPRGGGVLVSRIESGDPASSSTSTSGRSRASSASTTCWHATASQSKAKVPKAEPQLIKPGEIRFSKTSVNGSEEIIESMKKNGWQSAPIDVVRMDDRGLTTLDNIRVVAARAAGIDIKAFFHGYDGPLPDQATERRFTPPKGGVPQTWGQAVEDRIGKQSSGFRRKNPRGSYNIGKIN